MPPAPSLLRGWLLLLALAAATVWGAGTAAAHASLVSTTPGNGTHAAESPDELTLQLNEPVVLVDGSAQLIDSAGTRFDFADIRLDEGGRRIVLVPAEPVPDGAYLATARVVSADTHVVSLSIQFTVGSVTEQGEFAETAAAGGEQRLNVPSKATAYLGLVLSAGLFLAARWVWPATVGTPRFRLVHRIGAALLIVGLGARFLVLVAQQSGGFAQVSVARTLLLTPTGLAIAAALGFSALALVTRTRTSVLALQAITAILAVTLGGHGGSVQGWPWSFAGTLVHVYAITVWLGGVTMLVAVLRGAPQLRRWHTVAAAHLGAVLAGGLILAILQVRPLAALVNTTYGQLLLLKVAVAVAVAGLGHLTYRALTRSGDSRPRTLAAAAALATLVLALTAALTTVPPAKDVYTTHLATTLDVGPADHVDLGIDTIRRGPQQLTVHHPRPTDGTRPTVTVDLSSAAANVARLPVRLRTTTDPDGSTRWHSDRLIVPAPGPWKLTLRFDNGTTPTLTSFTYEVI